MLILYFQWWQLPPKKKKRRVIPNDRIMDWAGDLEKAVLQDSSVVEILGAQCRSLKVTIDAVDDVKTVNRGEWTSIL